MPNAQAHDNITLITLGLGEGVYFARAPHPDAVLAVLFGLSYVFAGFACAGDLDLNSREYRRWGPLRFLWWPYQKCVPHRSWVSHGLILGGLIRALYLLIVTTLLVWMGVWLISRLGPHWDANAFTRQQWQSFFAFVQAHPQPCAALLCGFVLAGTAHSVADICWSGIKRRF